MSCLWSVWKQGSPVNNINININPRRTGGVFEHPPPHRFSYQLCPNLLSAGIHKERAPAKQSLLRWLCRSSHQVMSSDLTSGKVWILVKATPNDRSPWNFQRLISLTVSMQRISRNFDIGNLRSGQVYDLSIINQFKRKMKGTSFVRIPFETLSNIWLQVGLTPWVRVLRPVIPRHVANVISGHERSPAVFRHVFHIETS